MDPLTGFFSGVVGTITVSVMIYMLYKFVKPYMRRNEFDSAYYIAKLRNHAVPQNIDLDKEMKSLFRSELSFLKADRIVVDEMSGITAIDNTFKQAEENLKAKK